MTYYNDDLYKAINGISIELSKYHIGHWAKEKYGTARFEIFHYWDGTLHGWFRPSYAAVHAPWSYFWALDAVLEIIFKGMGLVKLVHKWQHKHHVRIFTEYVKKYPHLADNLLFTCNLSKQEQDKIRYNEGVKNG